MIFGVRGLAGIKGDPNFWAILCDLKVIFLKRSRPKFYFILTKWVIYFKDTGGNEMTKQEVKKFEKKAKSVLNAVSSSKSEARKLLVGTGMYTSKGNLKKAFK